jgi:hypothetical protein
MEKGKCQCGQIDLVDNMEICEDGMLTCTECATELKTEYVANEGIDNQNLN